MKNPNGDARPSVWRRATKPGTWRASVREKRVSLALGPTTVIVAARTPCCSRLWQSTEPDSSAACLATDDAPWWMSDDKLICADMPVAAAGAAGAPAAPRQLRAQIIGPCRITPTSASREMVSGEMRPGIRTSCFALYAYSYYNVSTPLHRWQRGQPELPTGGRAASWKRGLMYNAHEA